MTTLLKRLGLSHFRTISSDAYDGIDKSKGDGVRDGGTGLDVRIFDGQATVVAVEDCSPGFVAGIKRGWQIEQIAELLKTAFESREQSGCCSAAAASESDAQKVAEELAQSVWSGKIFARKPV